MRGCNNSRDVGKTTYGCMCRLVVDMHERSAHIRQDLDLVLQLLTQVVSFPERSAGVHDDVYLDVIILLGSL